MQPEPSSTPVTVVKNPGRERFEIFTAEDPVQFTGFLAYRVIDEHTVELQHTIISEGFSRRGFARTLVTSALDQIRDEGGRIVPTCSYVQDYLERFPQYADLVAKA
ncbi:GNAT family N-acetyltransferase [Brevibacterium sp. BDJS002]|uniref:GNAT family N-acetyltransferase n=1 Tax=Brevibacterium sp. BDJS002 TaxID=3020906 RepID=UPI002307EBD2|nr:GNAT family N-acetyltransferase [Brevibacterium sp. BDJS002]WCE41916.1 GNAT family N-acetyltransferase [Brevibacterium sp. BDJS002]